MTRTSTMTGVSLPTRWTSPLLEGAQKLCLKQRGQFADLIKEQRAAVGLAEPPFAALVRPCERALLVPEQFGLQQGFIEGRTVDGDERLASPGTGLLNGAGDPLLAGPRLPGNQDGRLGGRDRIHHLNEFAHPRGCAREDRKGLSRIYSRSSRFSAASRV